MLHCHLVFIIKYRVSVLDAAMLTYMEGSAMSVRCLKLI